jgi:hypothetical protein
VFVPGKPMVKVEPEILEVIGGLNLVVCGLVPIRQKDRIRAYAMYVWVGLLSQKEKNFRLSWFDC